MKIIDWKNLKEMNCVLETNNIEVTQMSMIKLSTGEAVVGLTLNLYGTDGKIKTNNYKVSLRLSEDDLMLNDINNISSELLDRVFEKINI